MKFTYSLITYSAISIVIENVKLEGP